MTRDSDTVPAPHSSATPLLAGLLVDQRRRWSLGERALVEEYCRDYPKLATDHESLLDLIIQELVLRERAGERPTHAEYLQRFPQLVDALRLQFALDEELTAWQAAAADLGDQFETTPAKESGENVTPHTATASLSLPHVAGYEILDELGRGGMAVVYRARDQRLNRLVAIKVLRDRHDDSDANLRRFLTEAQFVARLQHPHIVQVYEVGEHHGRPYLAFEYVDGGTLAEQLRGQPWPAREAAQLVETLSRAVQFAHDRGVLHRDLKPGNILLQQEDVSRGTANSTQQAAQRDSSGATMGDCRKRPFLHSFILKIADFGLAKMMDEPVGMRPNPATMTGDILGTATYMSPEQAQGESHKLTAAADVYSLGAILYELLTGRPPFVGTKPLEVISQVLHDEPPRPSQLVRRMPSDLQTICLKCLEKNPLRRYSSAAELAGDLARFLANEPIVARHASVAERAWRWCRRHPATATLFRFRGYLADGCVAHHQRLQRPAGSAVETHASRSGSRTSRQDAGARSVVGLLLIRSECLADERPRRSTVRRVESRGRCKPAFCPPSPELGKSRTSAYCRNRLPGSSRPLPGPSWSAPAAGEFDTAVGKSIYARSTGHGEIVVRRLGTGRVTARIPDAASESRLVFRALMTPCSRSSTRTAGFSS